MPNKTITATKSSVSAVTDDEVLTTPKIEDAKIAELNEKIAKLEALVSNLSNVNTSSTFNVDELLSKLGQGTPTVNSVAITSLYDGVLNLKDGNVIYTFERFGDTKQFSEEQARNILNCNTNFANSGFFYVHSDVLVKAFGLSELYETLLADNIIKNINDFSDSEIRNMVSLAPDSQKEILCDIMVKRVADGEIGDLSKITAIDKACGNTGDDTIMSRVTLVEKLRDFTEE